MEAHTTLMETVVSLPARLLQCGEGATAPPPCICGEDLDLYQPDPHTPGQLVALCDACGAWYSLIDISDDGLVMITALPRRSVAAAAAVSEELRAAG